MPLELTLKNRNTPSLPTEVRVPPGRFTVGRGDNNDLVVNVTGVSRQHAVIELFADGAQLSDAGAQNGTFVNGFPVSGSMLLRDGDVLSLGDVSEWLVELREVAQRAPVMAPVTEQAARLEVTLKNRNAPGLPAEVRVPPGRFTLGRSDENDLMVNITGLSRRHAVLDHLADGVQLTDAGSQNGTYVNGQPVSGTAWLFDGDVLSLGGVCEWLVQVRPISNRAPMAAPAIRQAQLEVMLKNRNASGLPPETFVPPGRFTLGRGDESDLVAKITGVSRLHAVLDHLGDRLQLSDAGSQNGTYVNGQPISGTVTLRNGDVLSLGGVCEWLVQTRTLGSGQPMAVQAPPVVQPLIVPPPVVQPPVMPQSVNAAAAPAAPFNIPVPVLAAAAAGLIIFAAFVVILIGKSMQKNNDPLPTPDLTVTRPEPTPVVAPSTVIANEGRQPCAALTLESARIGAQRVAQRVSEDGKPYVGMDDQALEQLKIQLERLCASPVLERQLQQLQQSQRQSEALQRLTQGQLDPYLLAYAALAQTVETGGDPLAKAREMAPTLIQLKIHIGSGTAESTLLFVAAYSLGGGTPGVHPLTERMKRADMNPMTSRDVWEACRRGVLQESDCRFITRFLAVGAIALNPRQFGLNAEPLQFAR